MRSTEERIIAVKRRAEEIERRNRVRRGRVLVAGSFAASLLILIGLSLVMPRIVDAMPEHLYTAVGAVASMFDGSRFAGYIAIGLLAFCLGVSVTILAYKIKKLNQGE